MTEKTLSVILSCLVQMETFSVREVSFTPRAAVDVDVRVLQRCTGLSLLSVKPRTYDSDTILSPYTLH